MKNCMRIRPNTRSFFSSVTMIIVFQILFVTGVRDYQLKTSGGRQRSREEMLKFWESIEAGLVY